MTEHLASVRPDVESGAALHMQEMSHGALCKPKRRLIALTVKCSAKARSALVEAQVRFSTWMGCTPTTRLIVVKCYAKTRPAPSQASLRFSKWLAATVGKSRGEWRFSPMALASSHEAHHDVFVMQVQAELLHTGGDGLGTEHFQDFRVLVRNRIPDFFRTMCPESVPQAVVYSAQDMQMGKKGCYSGVDLFSGFRVTHHERAVTHGRSSVLEAATEVFYTVGGIAVTAYAAYRGSLTLWNAASTVFTSSGSAASQFPQSRAGHDSNPTASATSRHGADGYSAAVRTAARDIDGWARVTKDLAQLLKHGSTPFWNREGLQSLRQGCRQLHDDCGRVQEQFDKLAVHMRAIRVKESHDSRSASSSARLDLPAGRALEMLELLVGLTNLQLEMKATLDGLVPLHEKEFTTEKRFGHVIAAVAGATVMCLVTGPWALLALGSTAPSWMIGAAWFTSHAGASVCIGAGASATTAVCGTMSSMNSKQRKLVESVRTSQMNVKDARDLTLAKMVLFLVHVEELDLKEDLGVSDKIAFCEMLGLQPDFLSDRKYNLGLVDESWARLSAATNEYLKDCNALAESFD